MCFRVQDLKLVTGSLLKGLVKGLTIAKRCRIAGRLVGRLNACFQFRDFGWVLLSWVLCTQRRSLAELLM